MNLQPNGPTAGLGAAILTPGMARAIACALVFLALAFVLLRPLCEFTFAGDGRSGVAGFVTAAGQASAGHPDRGDAPTGLCCESVKDGSVLKAAGLLASWTGGDSPGVLLFASAGLLLFARPREPARRLPAVLPERSFYARSARILR